MRGFTSSKGKLVRNSNRDELIAGLKAILQLWSIASKCKLFEDGRFQRDQFREALEIALAFKQTPASPRGRKFNRDVQVGHVVPFDPTIPELAPFLDQVRTSKWIQQAEHVPLALDLALAYAGLGTIRYGSPDRHLGKSWRDLMEFRLDFKAESEGDLGRMVEFFPHREMQKLLSFFISVSQPAWSSLDHFYFLQAISTHDQLRAPMEVVKYARIISSCETHARRFIDKNVLDKSNPREQSVRNYDSVLPGLSMLSCLVELRIGNYERIAELIRSLYPTMMERLDELESFHTAVTTLKVVTDVRGLNPGEPNSPEKGLIEKLLRKLLSKRYWDPESYWTESLTLIVCLARIRVQGDRELSQLAKATFERAMELLLEQPWFRRYAGYAEPFLLVSGLEALAELQVLDPRGVRNVGRTMDLNLSRLPWRLSEARRAEYHIRCAHALVTLELHEEAKKALTALKKQVDRSDPPTAFAGPVGYFGHPFFSRVIGTRVTLFRLLKRTCMLIGATSPEYAFERLFGDRARAVTTALDFKSRGERGFRRELTGLELRMSKILSLLSEPSNGWSVKTEIVHSTIVKTYEVDFVLVFDRCNMLMIEVDSALHHNVFGDETLGPKGRDILKGSVLGPSLIRVTDEEIRRWEKLTPPEAVRALTARLIKTHPTREIPESVMNQLSNDC